MKKFLATICMTAMMAFAWPSNFTIIVCPLTGTSCEKYNDAVYYMKDNFFVVQTITSKIFYNMQGWSIRMELK